MSKNSANINALLLLAFPQALLRAIAIQDVELVKALLALAVPEPVKDSEGTSALVYAAGQGDPEIVNLLLANPAYSKDTAAIEQALEVVAARLRYLASPAAQLKSASMQQILQDFTIWLLPASYQKHFKAVERVGRKTDFPTYEQYQQIIKILESHLEQKVREQLQVFIDQAKKEKSVQAQLGMPEEIQQEIFDKLLGNKDIFKRLFRPTS